MQRLAEFLLMLAASAAPGPSDRAVFNLAIAGTRGGPPDLSALIVKHRREFLGGVREAARRPPPPAIDDAARATSRAILARAPFTEVISRTGSLVGAVLSAEMPPASDGFERASAGPYRIPGVSAAAAAGDPAPVARSIGRASADLAAARASADAVAARIVADETNLLWAIWIGAGGDARPAKQWDERNGPYVIAGAPR